MSRFKESNRRFWVRLFGTLSVTLALISSGMGQTNATSYFQGKYDALVKAYAIKDLATVASILAPDYKSDGGGKALDRAKTIDNLRRSSGVFRTVYRKVSHVGFKGGVAYVVEDSLTSGKTMDAGTNIYHVILLRQHCIDQWEKFGTEWKLKHVGVSGTFTTKDGKPFKAKRT